MWIPSKCVTECGCTKELTKEDVGLGNVDNTSDLSKPLSVAMVDALATKADRNELNNLTAIVGSNTGRITALEQGGGGGSGGEPYDDTELRNRVGTLETATASIRTSLNAVGQKADANESSILSMASDIEGNQTAIQTNSDDIDTLESGLSALDARVVTNTSNIQTNADAIDALESDLSEVDGRVATNTRSIGAINTSIGALQTAVSAKQDTLTAGSGIDITQNVISVSATSPISSFVADSSTDVSHFIDSENHYTRDVMILSGNFRTKLNFFKGEVYSPNSYLGCQTYQTVNVQTGATTYDIDDPVVDVKAIIQSASRTVTSSGNRIRISTDGDTQTITMDSNILLSSMTFTVYTRE